MLGLPPGCGTMKSMLGDGVGTQSVMAMSPSVTRQGGVLHAPTGEGLTTPRSFSRWRRCTLVDNFRIT